MLRAMGKAALALLLVAMAGASAQADGLSKWNTLNRKLGLGWSDGYHAYNGCEGQCGWNQVPAGGSSPAVYRMPPQAYEPHPTPALRPTAVPRTTRRAASGPVLPSQRQAPKPTYWYR